MYGVSFGQGNNFCQPVLFYRPICTQRVVVLPTKSYKIDNNLVTMGNRAENGNAQRMHGGDTINQKSHHCAITFILAGNP